jgi:hypothetical protein
VLEGNRAQSALKALLGCKSDGQKAKQPASLFQLLIDKTRINALFLMPDNANLHTLIHKVKKEFAGK